MKRIILLFILICLCNSIYAQINIAKEPYSFRNEVNHPTIVKQILPQLNMSLLEAEDLIDAQRGIPPRFGFPHVVDLSLENSGTWVNLQNGDRLWFLKIQCPDAKSINLLYDKFWLPENAEFYIYSEDKKRKTGMFSSRNNKGAREQSRGFATGLIFSDIVVLSSGH